MRAVGFCGSTSVRLSLTFLGRRTYGPALKRSDSFANLFEHLDLSASSNSGHELGLHDRLAEFGLHYQQFDIH